MGTKLKALRQTHGSYGTVAPGEVFEAENPSHAEELVKAGIAERASGDARSTRKGKGATETKAKAAPRKRTRSAAKKSSGGGKSRSRATGKASGDTSDPNVITTANYRGQQQTGQPKDGGE
jgi:hypothetical protein